MNREEHIGTIKGRDIKVALGHQEHQSGCGAHRNRRKCRKLRRENDRRACQVD